MNIAAAIAVHGVSVDRLSARDVPNRNIPDQKTKTPNKTKTTMKTLLTAFTAVIAMSASVFAGEFPDISLADLKKAIADKKVALIDVNGSDSYKAGHIPGAVDFAAEKDLAAKLPADKASLVVAYCGGPACGAYAAGAKKAKALGYTNVKHFANGISGWKSAGEKTEAAK